MSKPAELLLFEFLSEQIAAAERGSLLDERTCELHDTIYQTIKKSYGWRISDAVSELRPGPGGGLRELDAEMTLVCFAKVEGTNKKHRADALQLAYQLETKAVELFLADPELGGRVCDIWVRRSPRGYDNYDSNPYAIVNMPLVINPTSYEE